EIRPCGIAGRLAETWIMEEAKRARKAETPKRPSRHLRSSAPYFYPDHPVSGNTGLRVAGFPVKFSESEAGFERPAPYCGEHNEEVYKELLGLSDEELEALKEENII
ncbi:MAG: hypothetical protein K9M96_02415, partial [Deltaproteobacteria bacterium]|nr:hypothetical protein [Deltaproteobacteria bacterium]